MLTVRAVLTDVIIDRSGPVTDIGICVCRYVFNGKYDIEDDLFDILVLYQNNQLLTDAEHHDANLALFFIFLFFIRFHIVSI